MQARRVGPVVVMAALLAVMVAATAVGAQGPASGAKPRTVWDGVYSEEQAQRGEAAYRKECAMCHFANLLGEDFVPPLVEERFLARWENDFVGNLFTVIQSTMPQDRPAELSADTYADIVAYVLKKNQFPAGQQPLSKVPADLMPIAFKKP